MTKEQLAIEFIALFPQHEADYDEHLKGYEGILGHIFFGDLIDEPLTALLRANTDKESIQKYMGFIEQMYTLGDENCKNIVVVTILEYLGDDDVVLKNAFEYLPDEIIEESRKIEAFLRRRKIVISHEEGRTRTSW